MKSNQSKEIQSAIIIANGRYPSHEIPLQIIENASLIVCTDGAANHFISIGGIPDAIVGDCDSISEENKIKFANILHPDTEQESNDLTKSVRFLTNRNIHNITIVGGTGLRDDHTIGNISLLAEYIQIANVRMITNSGIFTPTNRNTAFNSFLGEQISIFSIDKKPITTEGLKYPIKNRVLNNWWEGTLNESLGDEFTIKTEGRVLVFQVFKKSK